MPHRRRTAPYRLRTHEIDPLLTYDGIKDNPLSYIDHDIHPIEQNSLCLAELYLEHWTINLQTEQIILTNPYLFILDDEQIYLKTQIHPLKWFYELIQTNRLSLFYSSKQSTLYVVFSFEFKQQIKFYFNLFAFYSYCHENNKTKQFFKSLFTFDNYQSLSDIDENMNAMNIIDFIYQEIQASTMIEQIDRFHSFENLLNNEIIRLKDHQIKSIHWMLKREREDSSSIVYTPFHHCHDLFEKTFAVHIINGILIDLNEINRWSNEEYSLSGGILCDEMGLGKTMCVLLTSLVNKCSDEFLLNSIDEQYTNTKKMKFDFEDASTLPCLCGKLVTTKDKLQNLISICCQCSRSIHRKCYLNIDTFDNEHFLCPYCEQRLLNIDELLPTGATLIIAPAAILDQWIEEIHKHLKCSLKIYIYESIVNKIPVPSRDFLAQQDFLFCSYENLKKDIHHNEICSKEHHTTRTQQRKYQYLISPLLRLKFWRLVLDEAQMVDSPNTPASKMARSLVSHHRWFVTGTPFHRSINDLEGIIQYLFPLTDLPKDQIISLLREKEKINEVFLCWLLNFLKLITRRTSRQCLNDLPEQFEQIIRLQFSELERMYYDRIWNECRDEFKREFQHLWEKREKERNGGILSNQPIQWTLDSEIDMNDIHFLSSTARSCLQTPLIKLRCLCDHPQVGAYGVRHNDPALVHYYNRFHYSNRKFSMRSTNNSLELNSTLNENNQPFTMKDLLDLLTARELESGEDSLRLSLLNFNGLASLYLIQYQHKQTRPNNENNHLIKSNEFYLQKAIEIYERVIDISQTYHEQFHPDSFQLAHAYYNLSYALAIDSLNIHSKYTSEQTLMKFNEIKSKHQQQSVKEMNDAWTNFNEKLLTTKQVESEIRDLIVNISNCIKPIENDKLDIQYHVNRERQLPFTTWNGFFYKLVDEFDRLKRIRENLLIYIENFERQPNDDDVAKMASCSKCGLENNNTTNTYICIFCESETVMKSYNCSLQPELYSDKQIIDDEGTYLIYYINEILSKASMRSHESTRELSKILRTNWNDLLKKLRLENTSARTYSQQLKHLYLLLDEMLQCTSRLEFYVDEFENRSKKTKYLNRFRFNGQLIENERIDFEQQALDYLKKVIKHRQQFHYFQEQQQDYYRSITTNQLSDKQTTKCPMCHELFGDDRPDVCFFLCGHFFCRDCSLEWKKHEIKQRPHRTHIKCPICRREIPVNSLTVLKWRDQNSANATLSSPQKLPTEHSLSDDLTSPRVRRLIETQEHLTIQGRYGTKVDSIVSFILNLLHNDIQQSTATTTEFKPPLKILVFSQFTDVLNVLSISLKLNAISYLQFSTTKILQQFRQDPSISVLLMPLGKGAHGLNLTEAQHVILVEPQLHRSVELQAIARVRRLGQKYNTYVYRFIVNDTAEEVVLTSSRTAQTEPRNTHQIITTMSDRTTINRATSFADFELLYEINMARKIFFKSTSITTIENQLD